MIEPTYHGTPIGDIALLMRLIFTTLTRTWLWLPISAVIAFEFYCRHEPRIRALFHVRPFARPAIVRVEKAKARKAVA